MRLTLAERKVEAPGVESFILTPQEPLRWRAGQFLHYVLHHEPTDDRGSDRWFTVSSAPAEGRVMITTRRAEEKGSSFKTALFALKVGETLEISDVDGDFTLDDPTKEYVFIAGGIGATPFRAILRQLEHEGKQTKITLFYANRDEHIPYKAELEEMARNNPNLKIVYVVGGRIDEAKIKETVADISTPLFYVSGPEPMVDAMNKILKGMGVPEAHVKGDWFPGYSAEI